MSEIRRFRYRKPQADVEAMRYTGSFELAFLRDDEYVRSAGDGRDGIAIGTPKGKLVCAWGDWIVREADGSLTRLAPTAFEAKYEEIA